MHCVTHRNMFSLVSHYVLQLCNCTSVSNDDVWWVALRTYDFSPVSCSSYRHRLHHLRLVEPASPNNMSDFICALVLMDQTPPHPSTSCSFSCTVVIIFVRQQHRRDVALYLLVRLTCFVRTNNKSSSYANEATSESDFARLASLHLQVPSCCRTSSCWCSVGFLSSSSSCPLVSLPAWDVWVSGRSALCLKVSGVCRTAISPGNYTLAGQTCMTECV